MSTTATFFLAGVVMYGLGHWITGSVLVAVAFGCAEWSA